MTKPEPTPLPEPAGRLIGCQDDDLDGTHGFTAAQVHAHAAARDAAWQAREDARVAREREACAKLRQTAEQVLADMRAHGALIEWQTALDDAIRARTQGGGKHG